MAVVCVLGTAGGVFLWVSGNDVLRFAVERALEHRLQREVSLQKAKLDLGSTTRLSLTELHIENPSWSQSREFAELERLEIDVAIKPLFSRVLAIRRLYVENLTANPTREKDGRVNWEIPKKAPPPVDLIIGDVMLKGINVVYRDDAKPAPVNAVLDSFAINQIANEGKGAIEGRGSVSGRPFEISGHIGSIEKALKMVEPYPIAVTLLGEAASARIDGTVVKDDGVFGFDANILAETKSISDQIRALKLDLPLDGNLTLRAHLAGTPKSLSLTDIDLALVKPAAQSVHVSGAVTNVLADANLDLQVKAAVAPKSDIELMLPDRFRGLSSLDFSTRVTGTRQKPIFDQARLRLKHKIAELDVGLTGKFDLTGPQIKLDELSVQTRFAMDTKALPGVLGRPVPDIGPVTATIRLNAKKQKISIVALDARAPEIGGMLVNAQGDLGRLLSEPPGFALDPKLAASVSMTEASAIGRVVGRKIPEIGPLKATMEVSTEKLRELAALVRARAPEFGDLRFGVDGQLGRLTQDFRGFLLSPQVRFSVSMKDGASLASAFGKPLPKLGPIEAVVDLASDEDNRMDVSVRGRAPAFGAAQVVVDGRIGSLGKESNFELGPKLTISASMASTAPMASFFKGKTLPELGPVAAKAVLSHHADGYVIQGLEASIGEHGKVRADVAGDLGPIDPSRLGIHLPLNARINLSAASTRDLSKLVEQWQPKQARRGKIPDLGRVEMGFRIKGSVDEYSVEDFRILTRRDDGLALTVRARAPSAKLGALRRTSLPVIRDSELDVELVARDTATIAGLAGIELPELGPVRIVGRMKDRGNRSDIDNLDLTIGNPQKIGVFIKGRIGDPDTLRDVKINGRFEVDPAALIELKTKKKAPPLGTLTGSFRLTDADGTLGVEALTAELKGSDLISLKTEGIFDDVRENDEIDFRTKLTIPNPAKLARQFAIDVSDVGATVFDGHVSGSDEALRARGLFQFGSTQIVGMTKARLTTQRPSFEAKLYSQSIRLADLGIRPIDANAPTTEQKPGGASFERRPVGPPPKLFKDEPIPFDLLKKFDLDLEIDIESIEGADLEIDQVIVKASLADGQLKLDRFRVVLEDGLFDVRGGLDVRSDPVKLWIAENSDALDIGDLVGMARKNVPLDGDFDTIFELRASGQTPKAIANSLEGKLDIWVEDGMLGSGLLDLAAYDFLGSLIYTSAATKKSTPVSCAIVRFKIERGVAKSEAIVLDTPNTLIRGEGTIDLAREQIDLRLVPDAKIDTVKISTPITVTGALSAPAVNINPGGQAARHFGQFLSHPVNLLGDLFRLVTGRSKDDDSPCAKFISEGLAVATTGPQ